MTMPSKIAVITPVRNRREKSLRFLEVLYSQINVDLSVYIVDSNSTDGTADGILEKYPATTIVRATDDDYWTGATNRGIQQALNGGADKILTINDDAIIDNSFVGELDRISNKYSTMILAARQDFEHDRGLIWSIGAYHDWNKMNLFQLRFHNMRFEELPQEVKSCDIIEVDFAAGNGVLINRAVFERIGLYDEVNYPHYHADSEFLLRARANGIPSYATVHAPILYNDISDHLRKHEQDERARREIQSSPPSEADRFRLLLESYLALRGSIKSNFYGPTVKHHICNYGGGGDAEYLRNSVILLDQLLEADSPLRSVSLGTAIKWLKEGVV